MDEPSSPSSVHDPFFGDTHQWHGLTLGDRSREDAHIEPRSRIRPFKQGTLGPAHPEFGLGMEEVTGVMKSWWESLLGTVQGRDEKVF